MIKNQIDEIKQIVTIINQKDPNSVVIFLGDHGSILFRDYQVQRAYKNKDSISLKDFSNDLFKVFAAVKLPKSKKIEGNFSSVNIFFKVFSLLNPDLSNSIEKFYLPNLSLFRNHNSILLNEGELSKDSIYWKKDDVFKDK